LRELVGEEKKALPLAKDTPGGGGGLKKLVYVSERTSLGGPSGAEWVERRKLIFVEGKGWLGVCSGARHHKVFAQEMSGNTLQEEGCWSDTPIWIVL